MQQMWSDRWNFRSPGVAAPFEQPQPPGILCASHPTHCHSAPEKTWCLCLANAIDFSKSDMNRNTTCDHVPEAVHASYEYNICI